MLKGRSSALRGRFRIDAELLRGGMAAVFSALDTATGQQVALKRLAKSAPAAARVRLRRRRPIPEDTDETAMASGALTTTAEPIFDYRLLPLTIVLETKRKLNGAIAVCGGHNSRPVSHAWLGELGLQLYRAGDMISARTLG